MKKTKPEHLREFFCETCKQEIGTPYQSMKDHLSIVHGITKMEGSRQMNMHIDGIKFYESTFTWTLGEVEVGKPVTVIEHTRDSRTGQNAALWGSE